MPKKSLYNSYNFSTGILEGKEERIFTTLALSKVENLRHSKENSLDAIDSYKYIGTSPERFIYKTVFRESVLGFSWKNIYRILPNGQTERIAPHLNATHLSRQIFTSNTDITNVSVDIKGDIAHFVYMLENRIFYVEFAISDGIVLNRKSITVSGNWSHLTVKVVNGHPVIAFQNTSSEVIHIEIPDINVSKQIELADTSIEGLLLEAIEPDPDESIVLEVARLNIKRSDDTSDYLEFVPELAIADVDINNAVSTSTDTTLSYYRSIDDNTVGNKTFHHLKKWGEFTYENEVYSVMWSKTDAFFIVNSAGELVARIGNLTAPSFETKFFFDQNIVVDGDNIYIPLLLATKSVLRDASEQVIAGRSIISTTAFPQGLFLLKISIDKDIPHTNTIETKDGLIISGLAIRHYDGETINELGFSENIENLLIQTDENSNAPAYASDTTFSFRNNITEDLVTNSLVYNAPVTYRKNHSIQPEATWIFRRNDEYSTYGWEEQSGPSLSGLNIDFDLSERRYANSQEFRSHRIDLVLSGRAGTSRNGLEAFFRNLGWVRDSGRTSYDEDEFRDGEEYEFELNGPDHAFSKYFILTDDVTDELLGMYTVEDVEVVDVDSGDDLTNLTLSSAFPSPIRVDKFFNGRTHPNNIKLELFSISDLTGDRFDDVSNTTDVADFREALIGNIANGDRILEGSLFEEVDGELEPTPFTIRFSVGEENVEIGVTGNEREPDEDRFESFHIFRQGDSSSTIFNTSAGSNSVEGRTRTWIIAKGDFELQRDDYQITARNQLENIWEASNISNSLFMTEDGENINVENITISQDTREIKLFLDQNADLVPDDLRLRIMGLTTYNYGMRLDEEKVITFSRPPTDSQIPQLSGVNPIDVLLSLQLVVPTQAELDRAGEPEVTYIYSAFYIWVDQAGKEHISAQAFPQAVAVRGNIGQGYGDEDTKLAICIRAKSLNLTDKKNVTLTLLRARASGNNVPTGFKVVVNNVPVNPRVSHVEIVDNKLEGELYGTFNFNEYRNIIQPPGATGIELSYNTDKLYLANIIGQENATLESFNTVSNLNREFLAFSSDVEPIITDGRVIGIGNNTYNILIFTDKGIYYIVRENGRPLLIQDSVSNYALNSQSIGFYKKGAVYANKKGIFAIDEGHNLKWIGMDVQDILNERILLPNGETIKEDIVSTQASKFENTVRFVLRSGRVLVYNFEYRKWLVENHSTLSEVDLDTVRYKSDFDGRISVTTDVPEEQENTRCVIETAWLNYEAVSKAILMRTVYLFGYFGEWQNRQDFRVDFLINGKDLVQDSRTVEPIPSSEISNQAPGPQPIVSTLERGLTTQKFSVKYQKISSLKIRVVLNSKRVKLSSLGFEVRKQEGEPQVGAQITN